MGANTRQTIGFIALGAAVIFTGGAAIAMAAGLGELTALGGLAIGALGAVGSALAFGANPPTPANPHQQGHIFKGTTTPQKVIYGAMRVSGPMYEVAAGGNLTPLQRQTANSAVVRSTATAPTTTSEYLHVIIPLAGHEVESIGNVIINNELVSAGTGITLTTDEQAQVDKYAAWVRVNRHLGSATQLADPDLVAEITEWTDSHRGQGIAYIYLRLLYNKSLYPQGIRNIQADVLGKKVYDPRTATTAWSENWALCVRDYMTDPAGLNMAPSEIDDAYMIAAANISDEVIPTANSGSQNRYTCNGTLDLSRNPMTLLKSMLTAGAGSLIPSVEGKARLIPGAYATPVLHITESDLRGGYTYKPAVGSKSKVNTLIGQYKGPDSSWVQVSFPQVGVQAYVTEDGGVIKREIKLPFCTDHERCQRIAKLHLEYARLSGTLTLPCKITMLEAATMENVFVTLPDLGFVDKVFRVLKWSLNEQLGVDLVLKEDASSVYAWQQSDATPFAPTPAALPSLPTGTLNPVIPGRVNGLEITGQAHNTAFSGLDAHLSWRGVTQQDYQPIGSEIAGANSGSIDQWFAGYEVSIVVQGITIRTEIVQVNEYVYTFEKNRVDLGGPHRAFVVAVRILGKQNQRSQPASLAVSNPAPQVPSPVTIVPLLKGITVSFPPSTDSDYAGNRVYASTTQGFTPSTVNMLYEGSGNYATLNNLVSATTYYIRFEPYDAFGTTGLNMSGEHIATTIQLTNAEITPGSIDSILLDPNLRVDQIPVIESNISSLQGSVGSNSASISSESSARVSGDSANATQISSVSSTVNGHTTTIYTHTQSINGIEGQYAVRINANGHVTGYGLISQGANGAPSTFTILADKFQLVNPANPSAIVAPFSVDSGGNAHFGGALDAASGTFLGSVTSASATSFYVGNGFYLDSAGNFRFGNPINGQPSISWIGGVLTIDGNIVVNGTGIIDTLQVAGEAITATRSAANPGTITLTPGTLTQTISLVVVNPDPGTTHNFVLTYIGRVAGSGTGSSVQDVKMLVNGVVVANYSTGGAIGASMALTHVYQSSAASITVSMQIMLNAWGVNPGVFAQVLTGFVGAR